MVTVKLYSFPGSPNCAKILICARELGLSLELQNVSIEELKQPPYREVHPLAKVPALKDGPLTLWESAAILAHLAGKDARATLLPREPAQHADTLRWLFFYAAHVHPHVYLLGWERGIKQMMTGVAGADEHRTGYAEEQLAQSLPVLDARLARAEYLTGRYSIADIASGVSLCALRDYIKHDLSGYTGVTGWLARLERREAWRDVFGSR
jgi:glutathione S-transferase